MHNLPDWFPEAWKTEVDLLAQQVKPAIADTFSDGGYFSADTVYFPRVGTVEAMDQARLQEFATTGPGLDWIPLAAHPKFLPIKIWDADKSKLTIPVVQEFTKAVRAGINRALDDMCVDALVAAVAGINPVRGRSAEAQAAPAAETPHTIGDYNTIADWDTISEAIAYMGEQDVDIENEDLTLITSQRYKVNLSLDPLMTSGNTNMKDLPWSKLSMRASTRLPGLPNRLTAGVAGDGTGVDMYLYARSTAVKAWNDAPTDIDERLGGSLANMFGQWFQAGAVVKQAKKLVRIKGKQNFAVTRKAIRVFDTAD